VRLLHDPEFRRFLRFLVVGAANTAWGVVLFAAAFRLLGDHVVAAYAAAALAIVTGFLLTGTAVFGHLSWRSLVLYVAWYALLASLNAALIDLLLRLGIQPYLGSALAAPVIVVASWVVNRYVIFRLAPPANQQPARPE
jgi:putative flippase GtrA